MVNYRRVNATVVHWRFPSPLRPSAPQDRLRGPWCRRVRLRLITRRPLSVSRSPLGIRATPFSGPATATPVPPCGRAPGPMRRGRSAGSTTCVSHSGSCDTGRLDTRSDAVVSEHDALTMPRSSPSPSRQRRSQSRGRSPGVSVNFIQNLPEDGSDRVFAR